MTESVIETEFTIDNETISKEVDAGGWCLIFSDGYYNMVLNFKKTGQLPRDENGHLKLRCKVRIFLYLIFSVKFCKIE